LGKNPDFYGNQEREDKGNEQLGSLFMMQ